MIIIAPQAVNMLAAAIFKPQKAQEPLEQNSSGSCR
jgi:hypothetical protein